MVRAILDGRKTQTRRVVKGRDVRVGPIAVLHRVKRSDGDMWEQLNCPYGQPGDRLWCRETWAPSYPGVTAPPFHYRATFDPAEFAGMIRWKPSIHMPRWASRIMLEIVSVRVERLQDITEADAKAEGCPGFDGDFREVFPPVREFRNLWDSINAKSHPWDINPWVWRIEFKRL
jgi:hypothetical protein